MKEALRLNYRVTEVYRIWHWEEWDDHIFQKYVQCFMKLKVESSGFPKNVQTLEEKLAFAQEYKEKLGIEIDIDKVCLNPGLRHISKLALNR